MTSSRERFEAWAKDVAAVRLNVEETYGDIYQDGQATAAWFAWCARDPEVARLVEALRRIVNNPDARIGGDMRAEAVALLREYDGEKRDE